jgi:hypothetical protein
VHEIFWLDNLKRRGHFQNLGIYVTVILKSILEIHSLENNPVMGFHEHDENLQIQ